MPWILCVRVCKCVRSCTKLQLLTPVHTEEWPVCFCLVVPGSKWPFRQVLLRWLVPLIKCAAVMVCRANAPAPFCTCLHQVQKTSARAKLPYKLTAPPTLTYTQRMTYFVNGPRTIIRPTPINTWNLAKCSVFFLRLFLAYRIPQCHCTLVEKTWIWGAQIPSLKLTKNVYQLYDNIKGRQSYFYSQQQSSRWHTGGKPSPKYIGGGLL